MTYNLLKLSLTLHIAGITMAAGAMLMTYVIQQRFWKMYSSDKEKAVTVLSATSTFSPISGIGMGLLILSGIAMMIITQGAFMRQLWFMIKLWVIVLIILNGVVFVRRASSRLTKLLKSNAGDAEVQSVKGSLNISMLVQLLLFLTIFTLAAFRFN